MNYIDYFVISEDGTGILSPKEAVANSNYIPIQNLFVLLDVHSNFYPTYNFRYIRYHTDEPHNKMEHPSWTCPGFPPPPTGIYQPDAGYYRDCRIRPNRNNQEVDFDEVSFFDGVNKGNVKLSSKIIKTFNSVATTTSTTITLPFTNPNDLPPNLVLWRGASPAAPLNYIGNLLPYDNTMFFAEVFPVNTQISLMLRNMFKIIVIDSNFDPNNS